MNSTTLTSNKKKLAVIAATVASLSIIALPVSGLVLPESTEVTPSVSQQDGDERTAANSRVLATDEGENLTTGTNVSNQDGDEMTAAGVNAQSIDDAEHVNTGAHVANQDGDESQHAAANVSSNDDTDTTTGNTSAGTSDDGGEERTDVNLGVRIQD